MDKKIKARLIAESSYPGTLSLLLENDVEKAKKSFAAIFKGLQSRQTKMQSLIKSMPSGNYQTFMADMLNAATEPVDIIQGKLGSLSDAEEDAQAAAKEIGALLDQTEDVSRQINHMLKINRGAMSYMAQQVVKSNLHKGDDKDTPMMTILSDAGLEKQAKKELGDAIKKAINSVQIKKKKGFFASLADKIFGGFSALDLAKESKDELVDAILEMSPMEIGKFSKAIVNYSEESDKETEKIEQESGKVLDDIKDEAGAKDEDSEKPDAEDEEKAGGITREDLLAKVKKELGDAGAAIVKQMLDSVDLEGTGIKLENALRNRSLKILSELSISAEDYQDLIAMAIEDNEGDFKDVDTNELLKSLNKVFKDSGIDLDIEVKPPSWDDLDDKTKRRADLRFTLDGKYIHGGSPSEDTFDTLLFTADRSGLEAEDIEDMNVDFNNTFMDNPNDAPSLLDIPDFVDKINKLADEKEEFEKFKVGKTSEGEPSDEDEEFEKYVAAAENVGGDLANYLLKTSENSKYKELAEKIMGIGSEYSDAGFDVDSEEYEKARAFSENFGNNDSDVNKNIKDKKISLADAIKGLEKEYNELKKVLEGSEETPKAKKDDSGDFYLVPSDEKGRLEKAGFQLEEARTFARLRKLAGVK